MMNRKEFEKTLLSQECAAFFHDVGKVLTAKCKEGRLVFYGHAKESAMISRGILTAMGYENNEIE